MGAVVGAAASIGTAWVNTRHAAKLQREARQAQQDEQRRAFQRETLLQLQDEVAKNTELFGRSFGGANQDLNRAFAASGMNVMRLGQRLSDDTLRAAVVTFLDYVAGVHAASCEPQEDMTTYERMQDGVAKSCNDLNQAIGAVLRKQL